MTIKKAKRKLPLHDYSIVKATVPVLAIRGKLPVGSLRVLGCIGSLLKTHMGVAAHSFVKPSGQLAVGDCPDK
ncbi:hypothetical protein D3Z47_23050 [Lachnospiraceae bacterium]|jgi:hypothetical protein|nr:hypothetical protein [Lachnospiraceae bacterium]